MDFKNNIGKICFIVILAIVSFACIYRYLAVKSHFEESCERICAAHEKLCQQIPATQKIAQKDSVIIKDIFFHISKI